MYVGLFQDEKPGPELLNFLLQRLLAVFLFSKHPLKFIKVLLVVVCNIFVLLDVCSESLDVIPSLHGFFRGLFKYLFLLDLFVDEVNFLLDGPTLLFDEISAYFDIFVGSLFEVVDICDDMAMIQVDLGV